jgi:saxitoxin biosynthesis operon SxtJ-like protein
MQADHLAPIMGSDRSFGLVFTAFFGSIAAYRFFMGTQYWWVYLSLAVTFAVIAFAAPVLMRPLNILWFRLGVALNRIVSPFVLAVVFFGIIAPMAYIARLLGKDSLRLRRSNSQSYWLRRNPPGPSGESMKNQF